MQGGGGATIIDALVVELGLDPTKFTRGQTQAVQSLRQFQNQAEQSNRQMRQTTENTVAGLRQMTSGFGTLTAAALSAWTVLKTVQATLQSIVETGAHAARAGYGASWAGVGTNMFSAVANSLFKSTGASREGTQDFMSKLARDIAGVKRGLPPTELLKTLGQLGIGWDQDPTKIMGDLSEVFSKMTPAMAQSFGSSLGLDPLATTALSRGRADFNKRLAEAQEIAVTEKQAKAAQELAEAWRGLSQSWEALIRDLLEDSEVLRDLIKLMDQWLRELRANPEAMQAVRFGAIALAAVFGTTLVVALTRATAAMVAFAATPLMRMFMGGGGAMTGLFRLLGLAGLAVGGVHAAGGFDVDPKTGQSPAMSWSSRFKKWVDEKLGFKMLPDTDPRATPGRGASSDVGGSRTPDQIRAALRLVAKYESGDRNILNEEGSTAGGYYQITDPTWSDFSKHVPGANRWSRAIDAPRDVQDAVAAEIYKRTGTSRWKAIYAHPERVAEVNRAVAAAGGRGGFWGGILTQGSTKAFPALPEPKGYQPDSGPGFPGTGIPYKDVPQAARGGGNYVPEFIRRANEGARVRLATQAGNTTTNTYGGTSTGDIYVTVPPGSDVTAAGRAMTDAIRNEMTANKANTGLN